MHVLFVMVVHVLFAFGQLVGIFSCCLKKSGCVIAVLCKLLCSTVTMSILSFQQTLDAGRIGIAGQALGIAQVNSFLCIFNVRTEVIPMVSIIIATWLLKQNFRKLVFLSVPGVALVGGQCPRQAKVR
jgi:hypothetical protein